MSSHTGMHRFGHLGWGFILPCDRNFFVVLRMLEHEKAVFKTFGYFPRSALEKGGKDLTKGAKVSQDMQFVMGETLKKWYGRQALARNVKPRLNSCESLSVKITLVWDMGIGDTFKKNG